MTLKTVYVGLAVVFLVNCQTALAETEGKKTFVLNQDQAENVTGLLNQSLQTNPVGDCSVMITGPNLLTVMQGPNAVTVQGQLRPLPVPGASEEDEQRRRNLEREDVLVSGDGTKVQYSMNTSLYKSLILFVLDSTKTKVVRIYAEYSSAKTARVYSGDTTSASHQDVTTWEKTNHVDCSVSTVPDPQVLTSQQTHAVTR